MKDADGPLYPKVFETDWTNMPFINGWTMYPSTSYRRCQYKKVGNIVYLEGLITNSASSPNFNFATLPVGFRPSSIVQVPITGQLAEVGQGNKGIMLAINPNGNLNIQGYSSLPANVWLSLSGAYFFIE